MSAETCLRTRLTRAVLLGGTALFLLSEAHAEESSASEQSDSMGEIVVTAQKRATTAQSTPLSITALSAEDLADRVVPSLAVLAQGTPGVSLKSEGPSQTEIEMRGMTSSGGNSATVGFYLDDVPLSGPASAQNGHVVIDPNLYDLNRIEILRGPQGTLFGSGSMGGTIRLITNQPDSEAYHASAESKLSGTEGGGFNHTDNVMANIPLLENKLALRVVGSEGYTSGWIDRIVVSPFPLVSPDGTQRGAVQTAPVVKDYPGSNAYQTYAARTTLLWTPSADLTITPSFFFETSRQNGISAYDSVSNGYAIPSGGGQAHYQPFDIAEPLKDTIRSFSLNATYSLPAFDISSSTALWYRDSSQIQEATEAFNSPVTGAAYYANAGLSNPGYYGPKGTGPQYGSEFDPSHQLSEELRFTSKGEGDLNWVGGLYYSHFYSIWTFDGTTPNYGAFADVGTGLPATTPNWFDANSPTTLDQYAAFADGTYALTDALKLDVGSRINWYSYHFSSCISGWGSALGAAIPSCTGPIKESSFSFDPKVNLSYDVTPDVMAYGTVAKGFRPGGANAIYPTTGPVWGPAFAQMNYTSGKFPTTYRPDSVWSFEIGEKAKLFDHRLIFNASLYAEDWQHIQLEAYPNDWALNINGNHAHVWGGEVEMRALLGGGFDLDFSAGYLREILNGGPHWDIRPLRVLPEVAPESGTAALNYMRELDSLYTLTARLENTYTGPRYSLGFPTQNEATGAYVAMAAYDITNVRVGLKYSNSWTVTAFADNLFNKHARLESMFTENEPTTPYTRVETNQPLTAGVDINYRF